MMSRAELMTSREVGGKPPLIPRDKKPASPGSGPAALLDPLPQRILVEDEGGVAVELMISSSISRDPQLIAPRATDLPADH